MSQLPDFIIIGAGKSGTTSLYEYLKQHPQVFMSAVKETNFFALEGSEIKQQDDSEEQTAHYPWAVNNLDDYLNLFREASGYKAVGEVSPMYLYHPEAPKRIKDKIPEVKLVAILRQPVERLYSRYMHLVRESREPKGSFADALNKETIWWRRNDLVTEGFYGTYLSRYYELFQKDQIKVFLYEDLRNKPKELLHDLFEFIGVDPDFEPATSDEFNKSGRIKSKKLDYLIGQNSAVVKTLNKVSPQLVKAVKESEALKRQVNKWRNKNLEKMPLDKALKLQMTKEIYRNDIELLQTILNRDLSAWLH